MKRPSSIDVERRGHSRQRNVGQEAQPPLVDADQRNVVRRDLARDREHRAVAAQHDREVGVRGQFARRRGGVAGHRRVSRGLRVEDDAMAARGEERRELRQRRRDARACRGGRRGRREESGRRRARAGMAAIKPQAAGNSRPRRHRRCRPAIRRAAVHGGRIGDHAGTARAAPPQDAHRALCERRPAGRLARAVAPFRPRACRRRRCAT